jgi:quercetin dioxygenase-like cupin family protein
MQSGGDVRRRRHVTAHVARPCQRDLAEHPSPRRPRPLLLVARELRRDRVVLASRASVPTYTKLDAATLEPKPGPHPAASPFDKGVGQALGVRALGVCQVELPPDCETVPHDHATDSAEDVYAVISGAGTAVVDGEEVPLAPGEFITFQAAAVRHVRAGSDGLVFIAVCAPTRS